MKNYIYIEKVPLFKKVIGTLFLISGILCLLFINIKISPQLILLWIFLCFIGLFFISTEGIEMNFSRNSYRKMISFYGVNFGLIWKVYPKINYFTLFETNIKEVIGGKTFNSTASAILSTKVVKINLFDENNRHITLYVAKNREEALIIGEKIKNAYNVEMRKNF